MWTFSSGCKRTIRFTIIKCGKGGKQIKTGIRNSWHFIAISVFIGTSAWFYLMLAFGQIPQHKLSWQKPVIRSEPGRLTSNESLDEKIVKLNFLLMLFFIVHRKGDIQLSPDFHLSRPTVACFIWPWLGPSTGSCGLFYLASGTSYFVVLRAFQFPPPWFSPQG